MKPSTLTARLVWGTRWVDYGRATHLLGALNGLLERPRVTRMPSIAIYADSGMGKTMLMKRFLQCHETRFDKSALADRAPVIALQMVSKPTERRFYSQLLNTVGAPPAHAWLYQTWKSSRSGFFGRSKRKCC